MALLNQLRRRGFLTGVLRALPGFVVFTLILPSGVSAQALEYKLQAVFLFNFLQYTEWPPDSFPSKQAPLIIGVLGNNPFGTALNEAVADEKIQGRSVVIRYLRHAGEIDLCHALYISKSEEDNLRSILRSLTKLPVLTVGEGERFTDIGGHIRFYTDKGKLRFEVNLARLKESRIKLSSQLLKLAKVQNGPRKDF